MFNKPATGLFGSSGNTSFGFGSTAFGTQPTTGGLFGQNTAAPASTGGLFGGGSSTFGSTPASSTGFSFGAATATVQPTVQTGTGGGLFGASNTGFGTAAAPQTASLSLFGGTSQPMNGSAFGAQPSTAGGLFGGTSFLGAGGSPASGTLLKFVPVTGTDIMMKGGTQQSVTTKLQCITGMKEYESKSLEELRLEDYMANRKGPQQQQQQSGLGFLGSTAQAQTSSAFGVFGQPSKPAFTGFGSTTSTGTSTSLFGQPQTQQTAGGSLFGATSQPKSLFGTATTTAAASPFGGLASNTSLFGQSTAAKPGLFGTTPATQSTGIFGSTPAATSNTTGFGSAGFGASSTFGTGTTGGLFGQKPAAFGATAPGQTSSFGFGQPQQQPNVLGGTGTTGVGLFGAKSTASTTGFSFGHAANTNASFGGFGAPAATGALGATAAPFGGGLNLNLGGLGTGTSLFQQPKPNTSTACLGFTGFGQAGATTGLGLGSTGTALGTAGGLGASADLTAALMHQQQQLQQQLQILNTSPYGDSPLFRNLKQDSSKKDELLKPTNPDAQKATLAANLQLKVTGRPNYKIKPKPLQSIITGKGQLFDGLEEDEASLDGETFVPRRNFKKLVIKNKSGAGGSSRGLSSPPSFTLDGDQQSHAQDSLGNSFGAKSPGEHARDRYNREASFAPGSSEIDNTIRELRNKNRLVGIVDSGHHQESFNEHDDDAHSSPEYNNYTYGNGRSREEICYNNDDETAPCHPTGIILRRPDYFTLPSLNELVEMMDTNGECWVENFVVGRDGYGNAVFPGLTNVAGLNLDEIVHFRSKEIDVYPNEENKPPLGEGLNKKAQVTLDRVWPVDKTTNEIIKDYDRLLKMGYLEKLEKASRKIGAKFIDYRHETGSWVFEVKHFSKYGLLDDSDDDNLVPPVLNKNLLQQQQQIKQPEMTQQVFEKQFGLSTEGKKADMAATFGHTVDEEDAEMPDIVSSQEHIQSQDFLESEPQEDPGSASSSFCLPAAFGVSATQVQLQKASFFGIDDDDDDEFGDAPYFQESIFSKKRFTTGLVKGLFASPAKLISVPETNDLLIAKSTFDRVEDDDHELVTQEAGFQKQKQLQQEPLVQHPLVPSTLSAEQKTSTRLRCAVQLDSIPYNESVLTGKQAMLMDLGLVHSRRSRVGWATGWILAHIGQPLASDDGRYGDVSNSTSAALLGSGPKKSFRCRSPSDVVIESVSMSETSTAPQLITDLLMECLQVELEHSDFDNEMMMFLPSNGVQLLHSYSEKVQSLDNSCDLVNLMSVTWTLCTALWGDLQLSGELSEDTYAFHQARKVSLAHWLTATAEPAIEYEIQRSQSKGIDGASVMFSYLTGGMIEKACEHALLCKDYHLALLMSQATGSEDCKTLLRRQLAMWADTQMDRFIDKDYLRLYALLAGTLVWNSSEETINTCADLGWKQCLALHLWFMCSNNATINESIQEYEKAFEGNSVHGKYAAVPRPSYMEKLSIEDGDVMDICYHLLKLYCDRTHPLHVLLNPSTMSGNQLDYSLSWHLLQILESLGYHHLSDGHHSMICANYASQLEALGLWHWAVFVLLHIRNYNSRADAVHQLLLRHVSIEIHHDEVTKEDFIVNSLHVQPEWIHLAKAVKAKAEGRSFEEAWHLLKAEKWNQCHAIVISTVAPEAVVNENFDMLEALLKLLADGKVSCQIRDWNFGGGLYVDYVEMMNKYQHVSQFVRENEGNDCGYEMEYLYELASSLGSRVGSLPCNNHVDSYCQAIISRNITKVMNLLTRGQTKQQYLSLSADLLSSLTLPEDFALETLSRMSHHALQAVLS